MTAVDPAPADVGLASRSSGVWPASSSTAAPRPGAPVTRYVPEVEGSGYDGATVRDVLDMRTGVAFSETYDDPDAEVRVMERSMGWRPIRAGDPAGMYDYLATLGRADQHGGDFVYRSADTDMLGWVCERAAETRMADLVSRLMWVPDGRRARRRHHLRPARLGGPRRRHSAVARDLARFGQMLLDDGVVDGHAGRAQRLVAPTPGTRPPTSARRSPPPTTSRAARRLVPQPVLVRPDAARTALVCLGIHGQMVYVDQATRTVGVKLSSWPNAQNPTYLVDTLRAFGAIGARLCSTDSSLGAAPA